MDTDSRLLKDTTEYSQIRISVRNLVEFILREGDIDDRHTGSPDSAMAEGSRIHRMLQKRMGADYRAEVSLKYTLPTEDYVLTVEGRADGIMENDTEIVIDEIKGTFRDVNRMREPVNVHVAQAKCYAYIYGLQVPDKELRVRMTYCNMETEETRYFYVDFTREELAEWFKNLIDAYRKWADYSFKWKKQRQASIKSVNFPFEYRDGQKKLVAGVYRTISQGRKLFLEAPTGVGKTISTVYPSVKAMGEERADRIFYLTAKTITRTVAAEAIDILRDKGLSFKSVILTAKEKICFREECHCNPEQCPYAKGHYDRINDCIFELMTTQDSYTRERIEEQAMKHQVCPFELCLDMSLFSDMIIGDYNYLFDPYVYLKRFFAEGNEGRYIFLVDEAHNLLERGREMYSAHLIKEDFLELKRRINQTLLSEREEESGNDAVPGQMSLEVTGVSTPKKKRKKGGRSILVKGGYGERIQYCLEECNKEMLTLKRQCEGFTLVDSLDPLQRKLEKLYAAMDDYLDEQEDKAPEVRDDILDFYFEVNRFLDTYERLDEKYVKYTHIQEDGSFLVRLYNVDPSTNLKEKMGLGVSTTLFSATLLPIQYYKRLLGGTEDDYEMYADSVFDPAKRGIMVATDVTTRYQRRSEREYRNIADYIRRIVGVKKGNYMAFFPSYSFMQEVYRVYEEEFGRENVECIVQSEKMSEEERDQFLNCFIGNRDLDVQEGIGIEIDWEEDRSLLGFCVLGGIFSEGIDLKRDSLIGAIIVGCGLPMVCGERELLRNFFDDEEYGGEGFDYSYRYPGMNKVLQAAGRVIRTVEDRGIVALLDDRFLSPDYTRLYPREWKNYRKVHLEDVEAAVAEFWDQEDEDE